MYRIKGITIAVLILLCLVNFITASQTSQSGLLLVSSNDSAIAPLSHTEVRKLFLGVPVIKDGVRLRPLLNNSNPYVTEIFLQKIVFMSKRQYERQLLSRVFRLGGKRPPEYKSIEELVNELRDSPDSVSYMWSDQFEQYQGLKSLGVLWSKPDN